MSDVKDTADELVSEGKDTVNMITDQAYAIGDEIKNKAGNISKLICQQAEVANENITEFIRENPYKSVIITFLAGFLIAKLV